jgi:hypothetical protein
MVNRQGLGFRSEDAISSPPCRQFGTSATFGARDAAFGATRSSNVVACNMTTHRRNTNKQTNKNFSQCIVNPILGLDAAYVIGNKCDEAPLRTDPETGPLNHGVFKTLKNYKKTMSLALLHETWNQLGRNFGERDQRNGKIIMEVDSTFDIQQNNMDYEPVWKIKCLVPFSIIKGITSRLVPR